MNIEKRCGYCRHERWMHEDYEPKGFWEWLFAERWFAGHCCDLDCDCPAYVSGRNFKRKEVK
jgi:hypothetical protein